MMRTPTTKRILRDLPCLEHEYGDGARGKAREIRWTIQTLSGRPEQALRKINEIIRGHGVECIRANDPTRGAEFDSLEFLGDGYLAASYVNMGDTYNATVLYDYTRESWFLTDYGTWLERAERRGIRCP